MPEKKSDCWKKEKADDGKEISWLEENRMAERKEIR